MPIWWTEANDEAAKHLAAKIRAAEELNDADAAEKARAEYYDLHGVKFALVIRDSDGNPVGAPVMLLTEEDADDCLRKMGAVQAATSATLHACEKPDRPVRRWTWETSSWHGGAS